MADIELRPGVDRFDIVVKNGDLSTDNELYSLVLISLFSNRRAATDDVLPLGSTDRMGWWGDLLQTKAGRQIGSRLWLLANEKITSQAILRIKQYIEEALAWLIEDGIAGKIVVNVERYFVNNVWTVAATVDIYKPDGGTERYRFAELWDQIRK